MASSYSPAESLCGMGSESSVERLPGTGGTGAPVETRLTFMTGTGHTLTVRSLVGNDHAVGPITIAHFCN
jgi:hypothetical protein